MNTKTSNSTSSKTHQRRNQQQQRPTSKNNINKALKDLNHINNASSSSSSVSIEAPKGCLRFFVSHNSSTTSKKTNILAKKCVNEKPILPKRKKNPALQGCRTSYNVKKESLVLNSNKNVVMNSNCRVRSSERGKENDMNLSTPLRECGEVSCGITKVVTPPIEVTVSPEIQCGTDAATMTPVCYGAGHVMSGVADKRKCRPRGVLVVGENCLELGEGKGEGEGEGRGSVVPLPVEASMRWLLSPCKEDDENGVDKGDLVNKIVELSGMEYSASLSSSMSLCGNSSGSSTTSSMSLCGNSSGTSTTSGDLKSRKRSIGFSSPLEVRGFQGFFQSQKDCVHSLPIAQAADTACKDDSLIEKGRYCNDSAEENSLFSNNSAGSKDVMRTPEPESFPDKHIYYPWFTTGNREKHQFDSEVGSATEIVRSMSLSAETRVSVLDPINSKAQSYDYTMPSSSFTTLHLPEGLQNQVSWESSYPSENMSLSQMRISWREGLVSQISEMDELDCCRYLSDEEEDPSEVNGKISRSHHDQEFNSGTKDCESKGNEKSCPLLPCPCTESISSDGWELFASGDSDWNLCYKDRLYELRGLVRSLSDQISNNETEFKENFEIELKKQIDEAANKVAAVMQRAEEHARMIEALHTSVAMYKRLYEEEHKLHSNRPQPSEHAPDVTS